MDSKLILDLIVVLLFIISAFGFLKAIRNTLRENEATKWYHIIVREVFGFEGERIIFGFATLGIMVGCVYFLFLFHGDKITGKKYSKRQSFVKLKVLGDHPIYGSGGNILSDLPKLREIFKNDSNELGYYSSIDFSFNQLQQIPSFVWEMKNLETINFQGNKLKNLANTKFEQLPNLTKIILNKNPIDTTSFKQIRLDNPALNIQYIPIIEN